MKSLLSRIGLAGFTMFIFMSSCREPKDLEFRSFENISIEHIGFSSANLKVEVRYYNPNNFGLELNRADLDIYLDSTYLGHSSQDLQVKIPRRQEFTIPMNVQLDMKNLIKNSLSGILNKQVMVQVIGKIKIGKSGVYKTFDLNYKSMQKLSLF